MRISMVVVVIFLVGALVWGGCGKRMGYGKKSGSSKSTPTAKGKYSVSIRNFAFHPSSLEVPVGTTVVWINDDTVGHTVSSDEGKFESGTLEQGDQFGFKFTTPGRYKYHCSPHPYMTAEIVVK